MAVKSIPTEFAGIAYRSRTEARWAVFFTENNIPFSYETEGFEIDGLRYVPDFWLPFAKCWFEVKPFDPLPIEQEKALRLAWATGKMVFLAPGAPAEDIGLHVYSPSGKRQSDWRFVYAHDDGIGYICDNDWNYSLKVKIRPTEAAPGMYSMGPGSELGSAGKYQFNAPDVSERAGYIRVPKGRVIEVPDWQRRRRIGGMS